VSDHQRILAVVCFAYFLPLESFASRIPAKAPPWSLICLERFILEVKEYWDFPILFQGLEQEAPARRGARWQDTQRTQLSFSKLPYSHFKLGGTHDRLNKFVRSLFVYFYYILFSPSYHSNQNSHSHPTQAQQ
jgi:hypothetical protein